MSCVKNLIPAANFSASQLRSLRQSLKAKSTFFSKLVAVSAQTWLLLQVIPENLFKKQINKKSKYITKL